MKNLIVMLAVVGLAVGCESSTKSAADATAPSTSTSSDAVSVSDSSPEVGHVESASVSTSQEASASLAPVLATPVDAAVVVQHADASKPLEVKKK